MQAHLPRLTVSLRTLLMAHVQAGRLRALPFPLIVQLLLGPITTHVLLRPSLEGALGPEMPSLEETSEVFTEAFLRAVSP
jgi:hypothetical protein